MYHSKSIQAFGGLDVKPFRRYVLEQILSGDPTEIVVENIHEYLTTIGSNVRSGKTKLDDFIIHKVSSNKLFHLSR